MRSIFGLITLLIAANIFAVTSDGMTYLGLFAEPTQTFIVGYTEEAACVSDQGNWDSEMEMCFFDVENTVEVKGDSEGYSLDIVTTGSNAHSCWFEGKVTQVLEKALVSEVPAETFNGTDWEPAICQVTVSYENDETVNVSTNGKCQEFCGARAWLEMGPATLKE